MRAFIDAPVPVTSDINQINYVREDWYRMSGHSKWSTIKNKKGKLDAQRGKIFTKMTRDIIVAVRSGGGADPDGNFRLRIAVLNARSVNMPMDNINRAIQRAAGSSESDNMEELVYEGYGPAGVAVMVDILTDNRNRSAGDIRHIFSKYGGNLGETGCVGWMFGRKGLITFEEFDEDKEDDLTLAAIDAGAENIEVDGDYAELITAPDDMADVAQKIKEAGFEFTSATITMLPITKADVSPEDSVKIVKLIDALEAHDDVQEVYTNINEECLPE